MTDVHFYDASLGTSGAAWDYYGSMEQKLLVESAEILAAAMKGIREERPSFVLVPGDLTKDGERVCHEGVAAALRRLEEEGIRTFVVPGNHDIENPAAFRYLPSGGTERVPGVTAADFAEIYRESGYEEALYRDPVSLSYVAEPVPGLWLLMLDSAKYGPGTRKDKPESSGALREGTRRWAEALLEEADRRDIAVIAVQHHPLLEHADGMKARHPAFVVDEGASLAAFLAARDVRLIFTGHFHANSAVRRSWGETARPDLRGKHIVDIETGALATWPSPYRIVRLSSRDGTVSISTSRVTRLPSWEARGRDFERGSREATERGLAGLAEAVMRRVGASERDARILVPQVTAAMTAHYAGDARFPGGPVISTKGLGLVGRLGAAYYRRFLRGLWKLKPPRGVELMADNHLTIFPDGSWRDDSMRASTPDPETEDRADSREGVSAPEKIN